LITLVLIGVDAALIGWRSQVVKLAPQTASLYAALGLPVNLRGLAFQDVKSRTELQDGVPVLVVEGRIASTSSRALEVRRLRLSVRDGTGHDVYVWTAQPDRSVLGAGEALAFNARLASPSPEARDVMVRFLTRSDLAGNLAHVNAAL
jgi:hypothetical protein